MKYSSIGMIELLEVKKVENTYSSLIVLEKDSKKIKLHFGIESSDYRLLKQLLEFHPFEDANIQKYNYFFTFSYRKDEENPDLAFADILIEQNEKQEQFEFVLSRKYLANLLWFEKLDDPIEIRKYLVG